MALYWRHHVISLGSGHCNIDGNGERLRECCGMMYTHSHPSSAFKYWFPVYQRVSYNLWKYKCRWVSTQLSSLKQSTVLSVLVLLQQTNNMQFKVISALAFATLAAAGAFPRADPTIAPPVPGTPTINASKCNAGQLQCCRFHFPKVVIVLQ